MFNEIVVYRGVCTSTYVGLSNVSRMALNHNRIATAYGRNIPADQRRL